MASIAKEGFLKIPQNPEDWDSQVLSIKTKWAYIRSLKRLSLLVLLEGVASRFEKKWNFTICLGAIEGNI